jgi:deoxyribodipyrimidine photolyase-like uncharacterized protein
MEKPTLFVILGNQLFPPESLPPPASTRVFMAEDMGLCTYEKHHQQKIVLFLAAMRAYADELRSAGYELDYVALDPSDKRPYEDKLGAVIERTGADDITHFEIEDKAMESRIVEFAEARDLTRNERRRRCSPARARTSPHGTTVVPGRLCRSSTSSSANAWAFSSTATTNQ